MEELKNKTGNYEERSTLYNPKKPNEKQSNSPL